jgi:hypothetical protein
MLVLNPGNQLILHVDGAHPDEELSGQKGPSDAAFEKVNGYVVVGQNSAIKFNGGKIVLINDDPGSCGKFPGNVDFWLLRAENDGGGSLLGGGAEEEYIAAQFGIPESDIVKVPGQPGVYEVPSNAVIDKFPDIYSELGNFENVRIFVTMNESGKIPGMVLMSSEGNLPGSVTKYVPSEYAQDHANAELAAMLMASTTMARDSVVGRLSDVKDNGTGPFAYMVGGHVHQDEIAGFGYSHDMCGLTVGADYRWMRKAGNEQYSRFGALLGYVNGDAEFFGDAVGYEKIAKHDMYVAALFGAYETFNSRHLKTNCNMTLGVGYADTKLHRVDIQPATFDAKMGAVSLFTNVELIKNLRVYNGFHFGLWLNANYSHVKQNGYVESTRADLGAQHVSKVNYDFLDTVIGMSVEKEVINASRLDQKLELALRIGWNCQPMRRHSSARVFTENSVAHWEFTPVFGYPARNSAIISANFMAKLNKNWNVSGTWISRFAKNIKNNTVSLGIEYDF